MPDIGNADEYELEISEFDLHKSKSVMLSEYGEEFDDKHSFGEDTTNHRRAWKKL